LRTSGNHCQLHLFRSEHHGTFLKGDRESISYPLTVDYIHSIKRRRPHSVTAELRTFVTAELLLHQRDKFDDTITVVTNPICTITNTVAKGCYLCPQGATAEVICHTDGNDTVATIQCEDRFFHNPITRKGAESTLRFSHTSARIHQRCNVSCGNVGATFEITGILQWVHTIHGYAARIIAGEATFSTRSAYPTLVTYLMYSCIATTGTDVIAKASPVPKPTSPAKPTQPAKRLNPPPKPVAPAVPKIMDKAKKTSSATTGTDVIAKASPVPKPTSPAKPTQPAKRLNPPPKPVAPAVPKSAPPPLPSELLQQGSRVLQLAASKVDQLAPAITAFEKLLQAQQEQSVGALKAAESKIDKLVSTAEAIETRISQMEKLVTETVAIPKVQEQSSAPTQWKDLQEDIRDLKAKVEAMNMSQLLEGIDELNGVDRDQQSLALVEPSPELERIQRQIDETNRELKGIRDSMVEVNNSIERERREGKGRTGSARAIDDLKQRRSRLQAKEDRVEREMRDLEHRLERAWAREERGRERSGSRRPAENRHHESG
ncbi:hypothetical protein COOONC_13172, partial [Cooperia oncophora]